MKELYCPTNYEVDLCLASLEAEEQRQREALRKFYERERPPAKVGWWTLGACFVAVLGVAAALLHAVGVL